MLFCRRIRNSLQYIFTKQYFKDYFFEMAGNFSNISICSVTTLNARLFLNVIFGQYKNVSSSTLGFCITKYKVRDC